MDPCMLYTVASLTELKTCIDYMDLRTEIQSSHFLDAKGYKKNTQECCVITRFCQVLKGCLTLTF